MLLLVIIYFGFFAYFAWQNFRYAVGFFILTLPVYLIRFKIGNLPSTLLEAEFVGLFLVWIIKYFKTDFPIIVNFIKKQRGLFIFIGLFFVASVVNIFISGITDSNYWHMTVEALGLWRAYFLEPMLLFVILCGRTVILSHAYRQAGEAEGRVEGSVPTIDSSTTLRYAQNDKLNASDLIVFLALSTISISMVAILQKISPWFFPPQLWDDIVGGRVTSFFTTPNAIGLYIAPVLFLILIIIIKKLQAKNYKLIVFKDQLFNCLIVVLILGLLAILLSVSQGAWVALVAGVMVFIYFIGWKKFVVVITLVGMALALYLPSVRMAVLFQDPAGQNRLKLWSYSGEYLSQSPQNFIFGAGIRKFFDKIQKPHYNNKDLEPLQYPHNLFLNFWTEIGLIGALSFVGIILYLFWLSWQVRKNDKILGVGLMAVLTVFCVHGLVDVPYFKNDLAFIFWIIVSVILNHAYWQAGEAQRACLERQSNRAESKDLDRLA
ncbi:MAG: O-antigen ligase family protein [Candidatus Magasanikbacteria bacterium]